MEILKFKIKNLQNAEYMQFSDMFIGLVNTVTSDYLGITPLFVPYTALYSRINTVFLLERGSALTTQINEADIRRDLAHEGIDLVISGYENHYDSPTQDAAHTLRRLFDRYGDVRRMAFGKETALVRSLVEDLQSAEFSVPVQTLNLTAWVGELKTANDMVDSLMNQRFDHSKDMPTESMAELRLLMDDAYQQMIRTIEARMMLDPSLDFSAFILPLNARIAAYKTAIKARSGKRKPDETKPEVKA